MRYKTIKISLSDYILLEELRIHIMRKRKTTTTKKNMLGWLIRIAHEENFKK